MDQVPEWMKDFDTEDSEFIRKFLLSSGSLKETAKLYGVSYPTVRLRLDRVIQKIRLSEQRESDPYVTLIQKMVIEERISLDAAKHLIAAYQRQTGKK
jgi:hypothetical protein